MNQKKSEVRLYNDIDTLNKKHQEEMIQSNHKHEQINTYFPYINELIPLATQCRELGFTEEMTRQLVNLQPVEFKGNLYSKEYRQKFKTEHSTAIIKKNPEKKEKFHLCIDGITILEWFRMKFQEIKQKLNITSKMENGPNRGLKM